MSLPLLSLYRAIPRLGWGVAMIAACVVLALAAHGAGLRWDPFDLNGRRARAAETRAAHAKLALDLREREAAGREAQQRRIEIHHRTTLSVAAAAGRAETLARSAHDATTPLDPARLDRLREHDRRLCDAAPVVCTTAAADPSARGDDALPVGPAA